jgi:hypothetical protein
MNIRIRTRALTIINNSEYNIIKYDKEKPLRLQIYQIFTQYVGCIGAPSRRTVFVRGTNAKR